MEPTENIEVQSVSADHSDCMINFTAIEDAFYVIGGKWKLKVIILAVSSCPQSL